jgi:hypothetical protein
LSEKRKDFAGEMRRILDAGNVRSVEFGVASAGNVIGEEVAVGGRCAGIVGRGENQGGNANVGDLVSGVEIADGATAADVAVWIQGFDAAENGGDSVR